MTNETNEPTAAEAPFVNAAPYANEAPAAVTPSVNDAPTANENPFVNASPNPAIEDIDFEAIAADAKAQQAARVQLALDEHVELTSQLAELMVLQRGPDFSTLAIAEQMDTNENVGKMNRAARVLFTRIRAWGGAV